MLQLSAPSFTTKTLINLVSKTFFISTLAAIALISPVDSSSQAKEVNVSSAVSVAGSTSNLISQRADEPQRFADGAYLYGQADAANELGSAYLVFETRGDQFIGAFYMPHSSFDCVYGEIAANRLDMTIVNSYGEGTYAYAVNLVDQSDVAGAESVSTDIGLEGFNQIEELTETDQSVLAVCLDNYAQQVW